MQINHNKFEEKETICTVGIYIIIFYNKSHKKMWCQINAEMMVKPWKPTEILTWMSSIPQTAHISPASTVSAGTLLNFSYTKSSLTLAYLQASSVVHT